MALSELWMCVFCSELKTAYEMRISDWSSDVCSSDLRIRAAMLVDIVLHLTHRPDKRCNEPGGKTAILRCILRMEQPLLPSLVSGLDWVRSREWECSCLIVEAATEWLTRRPRLTNFRSERPRERNGVILAWELL